MITIELHYPVYAERWDYFRKTVLSMLNGRHSKTLDRKESPRSTVKTSIHIDTSVLMRVFKSSVVYDHLKLRSFQNHPQTFHFLRTGLPFCTLPDRFLTTAGAFVGAGEADRAEPADDSARGEEDRK